MATTISIFTKLQEIVRIAVSAVEGKRITLAATGLALVATGVTRQLVMALIYRRLVAEKFISMSGLVCVF